MRRIAIINQKGGVGKTTTTANLGAALAIQGRRVVVVDMDAQANLSLALGVEVPSGEPTSYSVLLGEQPFGACLRPTKVPGLQLLASNIDLSGAEMELASAMGREFLLRDALREWDAKHRAETGRSAADYVLFDCPPSLGLLSINALAAAGEVLITLQTEFLALQGMSKLVEVVQLLKRRLNPELVITGIVPTLYDSRLKLAREVLGEIRTYFKGQVVPHPVRANVKLAETPSFAQTIFEYAPDSNGAYDYMMLAKELLARESRDADLAGLPPFDERAALPLPPSAEPAPKRVPPPPQRGPRKPKDAPAASAPPATVVTSGKPGETHPKASHGSAMPAPSIEQAAPSAVAAQATPASAPRATPRRAPDDAPSRASGPTPTHSAVAEGPHETLASQPPPAAGRKDATPATSAATGPTTGATPSTTKAKPETTMTSKAASKPASATTSKVEATPASTTKKTTANATPQPAATTPKASPRATPVDTATSSKAGRSTASEPHATTQGDAAAASATTKAATTPRERATTKTKAKKELKPQPAPTKATAASLGADTMPNDARAQASAKDAQANASTKHARPTASTKTSSTPQPKASTSPTMPASRASTSASSAASSASSSASSSAASSPVSNTASRAASIPAPAPAPNTKTPNTPGASEPRIVRAHELPPLPPDAFEILSTPFEP